MRCVNARDGSHAVAGTNTASPSKWLRALMHGRLLGVYARTKALWYQSPASRVYRGIADRGRSIGKRGSTRR